MAHKAGEVSLAEYWCELFYRTFHHFASNYVELINTIVNGCPHHTVSINIGNCNIWCI